MTACNLALVVKLAYVVVQQRLGRPSGLDRVLQGSIQASLAAAPLELAYLYKTSAPQYTAWAEAIALVGVYSILIGATIAWLAAGLLGPLCLPKVMLLPHVDRAYRLNNVCKRYTTMPFTPCLGYTTRCARGSCGSLELLQESTL